MKVMWIVVALFNSISFVIAGCKKQAEPTTPYSAHAVVQAAAPSPPSSTPTAVQKAAPVFVYSNAVSASKAAPTTNANLEAHEAAIRLDLPQADEYVVLRGAARTALSGMTGSGPVLLPDKFATTLMNNLPKEFRDSCDAMVGGWGENVEGTAKWTVGVLFSLRRPGGMDAVLAFRCASTSPSAGLEQYYDERPATVSLTPELATLNLIPIQEECDPGCSRLYRLEFSQAFSAVGARLAELRVYYSTDNPCCGGGDEKSANRMMVLDLSRGRQVLAVDERTEEDSYDEGTRLNTGDSFRSKTGVDNKRHTNAHQPLTSHSPTRVTIPPLRQNSLSPTSS
jgi:hypothetical protein